MLTDNRPHQATNTLRELLFPPASHDKAGESVSWPFTSREYRAAIYIAYRFQTSQAYPVILWTCLSFRRRDIRSFDILNLVNNVSNEVWETQSERAQVPINREDTVKHFIPASGLSIQSKLPEIAEFVRIVREVRLRVLRSRKASKL